MRPVHPIEDLRWFYQESEAVLGYRAQAIHHTSHIPSTSRRVEPTDSACAGANRQRAIAEALRRIPEHLAILEQAYELRHQFAPRGEVGGFEVVGPEDVARYGLAARIVRRVRLAYASAWEEADAAVKWLESREHPDKGALTKARSERRRIRDAAEQLERDGVERLRRAHEAYVAAAKAARSERRAAVRARGQRQASMGASALAARASAGIPLPSRHSEALARTVAVVKVARSRLWLEAGLRIGAEA